MGSAFLRLLEIADDAVGAVERILFVAPRRAEPTLQAVAASQRRASGPPRFRVVEVIEPTGESSWVVTNGYQRAVCNSAQFAEQVKVALE